MKRLAILAILPLATGAAAQQLPGAHGPESRRDCPPLTVAYVPPLERLAWPVDRLRGMHDPWEVTVRCEVISGGLLRYCSASSRQDHPFNDLSFVERYAMEVTVTDAPRACGRTTMTFVVPPATQAQ